MASQENHVETVKLLLVNGANLQALTEVSIGIDAGLVYNLLYVYCIKYCCCCTCCFAFYYCCFPISVVVSIVVIFDVFVIVSSSSLSSFLLFIVDVATFFVSSHSFNEFVFNRMVLLLWTSLYNKTTKVLSLLFCGAKKGYGKNTIVVWLSHTS